MTKPRHGDEDEFSVELQELSILQELSDKAADICSGLMNMRHEKPGSVPPYTRAVFDEWRCSHGDQNRNGRSLTGDAWRGGATGISGGLTASALDAGLGRAVRGRAAFERPCQAPRGRASAVGAVGGVVVLCFASLLLLAFCWRDPCRSRCCVPEIQARPPSRSPGPSPGTTNSSLRFAWLSNTALVILRELILFAVRLQAGFIGIDSLVPDSPDGLFWPSVAPCEFVPLASAHHYEG